MLYSSFRGTVRLKITTEPQPENQVLLEIEVEADRVEKSLEQAYKRMVGKYRIPGFRPGKAPRVMFERYVGRATLMREALEKLVPQVYEEAVKEEALDPIDQPVFDIPSTEPLLIKATVPLRPRVELGPYREELRIPAEEPAVTEEEIDSTLQELRRRFATVTPVERPVQQGDRLRVALAVTIEDREILNEDDSELVVNEEPLKGLPGLYEHLLGMTRGQTEVFEVTIPDDFDQEDMRGETAHYALTINEVKEEQLPALDDAFAVEVGDGFNTLAELHERITTDLRNRKTEQANRDYDNKIIDAVIAMSTLEYPPVLVDRESEAILDEQVGGNRAGLEAALRKSGGSIDTIRERFRPVAVERVQRSLVLTKLAETEGLSVDDADVDAEIARLSGEDAAQAARMREVFNTPNGRDLIARSLLTRKVYDRLKDIAAGKEVPPLPAPAEPAGQVGDRQPEDAAEEPGTGYNEPGAPAAAQGDETDANAQPASAEAEAPRTDA